MEAHTIDLRHLIRKCPECGQQYSSDSVFCPFDGTKLADAETFSPTKDSLIDVIVDGRYRVERILGEGGMGTVYQVRHTTLSRSFAMKVLRKDLAKEEELAARFIHEAKATAAIRHPHIVSISDFGSLPDGRPYFVMELLDGVTLSQLIKSGGPIPTGRGARMIAKVTRGLGAAHTAGVVHRDLKPENIVLLGGADGREDEDVRVVDFGAAMLQGATRLTKAGVVFGTPHYMSPEQAAGNPVDHRADIYALGVIMYEMFTGKVPFEGDTYMGVLTQHLYARPVPPSKIVPDKSLGALERVILHSLEKRPEDRFQSMEELEQAVSRVLRLGSADTTPAPDDSVPRAARMADELEPPTLEELRESIAGLTPSRSRSRGALGFVIAAVIAGIAAISIAFLLKKPAEPVSEATAAPIAVASASTSAAAIDPASPSASVLTTVPSLKPTATAARPTTAPVKTTATTTTTTPTRSASASGEFRDPWK